ncbi:glycosyl transferase [Shewanella sp. UCD-KL12]|uniref:glycosyl transferase n=1 Tax=Shewanella sp. UCD-KL12 TaxID=1917163 RepID=UPI0009704D34|nr:glycosyl transferase [Shewanella sp. UCD-KL12]
MSKAYQGLVKALGRGEKGSRALTMKESQFLIQGFSQGIGTKAQLAAALMLMRVRGETCEEVAGAALGIKSTISEQWSNLDVSIDWPCYAGKRELLPWLLLAAKVLAGQGERVLLHGDPKSLSHRKHIGAYVEAIGIPKATTPVEAKLALETSGICYVDADSFTPLVAQFRALHQELGLRSLFQTAIRCTNPANAAVSLRSYFHPGVDTMHLNVAKLMAKVCLDPQLIYSDEVDTSQTDIFAVKSAEGKRTEGKITEGKRTEAKSAEICSESELSQRRYAVQAFALNGRVGIFKGVQGETEVNPRISTHFSITSNQKSLGMLLPTRLEGLVGISTLSSSLTLLPKQGSQLLRQIWDSDSDEDLRVLADGEANCTSDNEIALCDATLKKLRCIAKASVISTLTAVYLLQAKSQSVAEAESLAEMAWRER